METKEPVVKYPHRASISEYLEVERWAENKHEYIDGNIIALAGASPAHNLILSNIIGSIGPFLKGRSCNIYPSGLRVHIRSKDSYFYPDAINRVW